MTFIKTEISHVDAIARDSGAESSFSSKSSSPSLERSGASPITDSQLPQCWQRFIEAERYLNGGSRTYSQIANYSELQKKYQPQSEVGSFSIPCVDIPASQLNVSLANPDKELLAYYINELRIQFLVHPQFYKDKQVPYMDLVSQHPQENTIEVAPTASSRTALVLGKPDLPPHCVKLHCPLQISRFNRKLDGRDIAKSVATSRELDRAIKEEAFPQCFGFLPESIGVSIGEEPEGWGYLVREMVAHPLADSPRQLLPLFSLYSTDLRQTSENPSQNKPLLVELIEKSKLAPQEFILDKLLLPIVESWCFLARDLGILAQAHGQNLLLELDDEGLPTRIIFRDLATYMDRGMRLKKGLSIKDFPTKGDSESFKAEEAIGYYSLTYDSFVGHHLFDYIAKVAQSEYAINPKELQKACQEKFKECFPNAADFFPSTVYYYSKGCTDGYRQDLEDTKQLPDWR